MMGYLFIDSSYKLSPRGFVFFSRLLLCDPQTLPLLELELELKLQFMGGFWRKSSCCIAQHTRYRRVSRESIVIFFIQGCHLIDYQNKWKLFGLIFSNFLLRVLAIKMILPGQDKREEEGGEGSREWGVRIAGSGRGNPLNCCNTIVAKMSIITAKWYIG